MKSFSCRALGLAVLLAISSVSLQAEDWKTTDGKVYQDVTVIKTEPDAVTILHKDGGALVPLANLPPDLQKRFNYDPAKAQVAAAARAKSDAENAKALQAEMDLVEKKLETPAQDSNPLGTTTETASDGDATAGGDSTGSTTSLTSPPDATHHAMSELVDINVKLRWDHPYGDGHYSMGALFSPAEPLTGTPDPNHHTTGDLFSGH